MLGQQKSKHLKTESGKCFNFRTFFYLIVQNHKSSNREKFVYIVSYTRKYLFNLTIFCQLIIFGAKIQSQYFHY